MRFRETLRVALAHDVYGAVGVGCDPETNLRTLAAAAVGPRGTWACLGFHPDWTSLTETDLDHVEEQVQEHHGHIVGIGEVDSAPELVNTDPYGQGWMLVIRMANPKDVDGLMSAADYEKLTAGGGH